MVRFSNYLPTTVLILFGMMRGSTFEAGTSARGAAAKRGLFACYCYYYNMATYLHMFLAQPICFIHPREASPSCCFSVPAWYRTPYCHFCRRGQGGVIWCQCSRVVLSSHHSFRFPPLLDHRLLLFTNAYFTYNRQVPDRHPPLHRLYLYSSTSKLLL